MKRRTVLAMMASVPVALTVPLTSENAAEYMKIGSDTPDWFWAAIRSGDIRVVESAFVDVRPDIKSGTTWVVGQGCWVGDGWKSHVPYGDYVVKTDRGYFHGICPEVT